MYSEHPIVGMTEIMSYDVENNFPNLDDAKKNLDLYKLEVVEDNIHLIEG